MIIYQRKAFIMNWHQSPYACACIRCHFNENVWYAFDTSENVPGYVTVLLCCCAVWDEIMIGLLITHLHIQNDFDISYRYQMKCSLIIITDLYSDEMYRIN